MGSQSSPSPEAPGGMTNDPADLSPMPNIDLSPSDEMDLPDMGSISLDLPESLSGGYDGSGEKSTPRKKIPKKKRKGKAAKKDASDSDSDGRDEPESLKEPGEIQPNVEDLAAHMSYFRLPETLFENPKVGPGTDRLGLPVGVYKPDPFEPTDFGPQMTIESRLEHYRLVLVNFTSTGAFRWNVASFNFRGDPVRRIKREEERVIAPKCKPRYHTSFFREHAGLENEASKIYLYQWMRHQWNMGHAQNWPNLQSCLFDPRRVEEREQRKARMEGNEYFIPFYRDEDFKGKDPTEEKAKVVQLMISALNAYRMVPFAQYQIISDEIDEHSLQELTWNFLWQTDVMCAVRDQILADHTNNLFPLEKARELHRTLKGDQAHALDRLVSMPLRRLRQPPLSMEKAGGPTIFGFYPRIQGNDKEDLLPDSNDIRPAHRPTGLDIHEARVFEKLGEFFLSKKVLNEVVHENPARPKPQVSQTMYAVDRLERNQAKAARRQLLYEQMNQDEESVDREGEMHSNRLSWWFATPDDDRNCPPSPKRRARKKKNPKDKDTKDDGKLSPLSAEYLILIEKMKARQRGEAAHQRFLRRKAAEAQEAAVEQGESDASGAGPEQGTEEDRPSEEYEPDIMDPDFLNMVLGIGESLKTGRRSKEKEMTPENEDMLDRDPSEEDVPRDRSLSEEMPIDDEGRVQEEIPGSGQNRRSKPTEESLEFYSNEPSHSSVSVDAGSQMDHETEPVDDNHQEHLFDVPGRVSDMDYPPASPQRTKSRRTTGQRGGSTTADNIRGRRRKGSTVSRTKDRVETLRKGRDEGESEGSIDGPTKASDKEDDPSAPKKNQVGSTEPQRDQPKKPKGQNESTDNARPRKVPPEAPNSQADPVGPRGPRSTRNKPQAIDSPGDIPQDRHSLPKDLSSGASSFPIENVRAPANTPAPVQRSKFVPGSKEQMFQRIQNKVYALDYYDLHYRHAQSHGDNAHQYSAEETYLLNSEVERRKDSLEGYGVLRGTITPLLQKEEEASSQATRMTTIELLRHQEYIDAESKAYNKFQKLAVPRELAKRMELSDGFWGSDGTNMQ